MNDRQMRIGILNPLPFALGHYTHVLGQLLRIAGASVDNVGTVGIERGHRQLSRSQTAVAAFKARRDVRRYQEFDRLLVAWPAFGYLEMAMWPREFAGRISIVIHDPLPLRRQFGLSPVSAGLAARLSPSEMDIVTHSTAAAAALKRFGFDGVRMLPLPMNKPVLGWNRSSTVLVLGQYKTARDIDLLVALAPELHDSGFDTVIMGRDWPNVSGWRIHSQFLSEEDFERELRAAACVILPYRRLFQSDVAVRAAEFGVPVVGPAVSNLSDLFGTDWAGLVPPDTSARDWLGRISTVARLSPEVVLGRSADAYAVCVREWAKWLTHP